MEENVKTAELCECCGERAPEPGQPYCADCLERMRKYPFHWWHVIVPVIMLMFAALAVLLTIHMWPVFSGAAEAEGYSADGKLYTALTKYAAVNADMKGDGGKPGSRYLARQVDLYETIGIGNIGEEQSFLSSYYTSSALKKPWNKKAAAAQKKAEEYRTIYNLFNETAMSNDNFDSLIQSFNKAVKGKGLNEAYLNYCRYFACLIYGKDAKTQTKYVDAIRAQGSDYANMYLPLYAEIALNSKDYDAVPTYTNQMKKQNVEELYSYTYAAVAYRMKGDLAKATKEVKEGLKLSENSGLLNYQMAILMLADNQYPAAEEYAKLAFQNAESDRNYEAAGSLYALIAELRARAYKKADNKEGYKNEHATYSTIVSNLTENGYEISPDVKRVLDGTKTIQDVFLSGEGDLTW